MPRDPLEPVYRLISSNRYTEAINFINKLLKKQPNFLIAKVWKSEALCGLGNFAESEELMESIIIQTPDDKRTLECIADFYRARGNYKKLVQVYENALKSDPSDDTWRKALFECCGLAGDYKKQQQQALILYKQNSRILFYCMAVVSLLQQADETPVVLELAERMMAKQADAGALKSKNEILLFLTVLERRKKYEDSLSVIEKHASELDSLISTIDKKIELFLLLEQWQNALSLLKQCLLEKPDSWGHYKAYVKTVLQFEAAGGTPDDKNVEDTTERAINFLDMQHNNYPKLRGPILAKLELLKLQISGCTSEKKCEELSDLIFNYFDSFGEKGIFVYDISQYISLLPPSIVIKLLQRICASSWSPVNIIEQQQLLGTSKHVSFIQLCKMTNGHASLSVEQRIKLSNDLAHCYNNGEESERRDHYLTLLALVRISLYHETGNGGHLIDAICHIEDALSSGPGIFALQVLLLQLYFALGAAKESRKIYEQLRIQSVQVDTLAHMFLIGISSTGNFSVALEMWENALKVIHQCAAESLEALVWSYRSGIFHRVIELTKCARRFQNTLTVPLLKGEKAYLEYIISDPSRSELILSKGREPVDWDSCLDNRDLSAIATWDPPGSKPYAADSFRELLAFCKLREATMNTIAAAVAYCKTKGIEDQNLLISALTEVKKLSDDVSAQNGFLENKHLMPISTRLRLLGETPVPTIVEKLVESDQASCEKVCVMLDKLSTDFKSSSDQLSEDPRKKLEVTVTQIEVLSAATLVLGAVRGVDQTAVLRRRSEAVVRSLESCWTQIGSHLNFAVPTSSYPSGCLRESVESRLRQNYFVAIDDMKKVVWKKVRYLRKLLATP